MALDHSLEVQIFYFDALVLIDQLPHLFEMEVPSLLFDLQMLLR